MKKHSLNAMIVLNATLLFALGATLVSPQLAHAQSGGLSYLTISPAPEQWFGTSLAIIVIFVICAVTVSVIRTKRGHAD